jgi:hypothetical protein
MDVSLVEAEAVQWRNLDKAIKLVRKVGILYKVYHPKTRTPLGVPVSRDMKKNGAPAHLKMTLTTALAQAETLQDITDFIKEVRNLEKCKVLSFLVERKREAMWPPKQLTTFITERASGVVGLEGNVAAGRDRISHSDLNHKVHVDRCFQKTGEAPMGAKYNKEGQDGTDGDK